jgi:molybdate transport system ATP-binding protein
MSAQPPPRALSVELHVRQPGLDVRAQFRVLPGRLCALTGRQGQGQSALLKAAAGLAPALSGRVALGPTALLDVSAGVRLPLHQWGVGWLDGRAQLFPHLNAGDNLAYAPRVAGHRHGDKHPMDVPTLTRWLDLGAVLSRRPAELPPLQRWKVALGRTLAARPHALLLDDVLGGLPDSDRAEALELLSHLGPRFKLPVVLATTRMDEVVRLADDMHIVHEGRLAGAGPVAQILSDVSLATFLEGVNAGSVLEGEVRRHDIEWLLSEVLVGGQPVSVPATLHGVGSRVRLKLRARDLSLHRERPDDTSSSNHLLGRVSQVMLAGEHGTYGAVLVDLAAKLDTDGLNPHPPAQLWCLLTRRAIQQMGWAPGQTCVLGFKAMATVVTPWR